MRKFDELDMFEDHFRNAAIWAKNKTIQLSEGEKPNRSYPIDEIDIGLIKKINFIEEVL